jgi:hypothetical protein
VRDTEFSLGTAYSRCEETRRRKLRANAAFTQTRNLYLTHRLVWIYFSWIYFSLTSAGFLDYLAHHKRHSFDPLRGGGSVRARMSRVS